MQINEHTEPRGRRRKHGTDSIHHHMKMPHEGPAAEDEILQEPHGRVRAAAQTGVVGAGYGDVQPQNGEPNTDSAVAQSSGGYNGYGADASVPGAEQQAQGGVVGGGEAGAGYGDIQPQNGEPNTDNAVGQSSGGYNGYGADASVPGAEQQAQVGVVGGGEAGVAAEPTAAADNTIDENSVEGQPLAVPDSSEPPAAPTPNAGGGGSKPLYIEPEKFRLGIRFLEARTEKLEVCSSTWTYINADAEAALAYKEIRREIYGIIERIRQLTIKDVELLNSIVDAFEAVDT